jgi:hypothetical protein
MWQINTRKGEWGEGKTGCIFGLLIILSLGYLAYKFIPPIVNNYQFQDAVDELASFSLIKNPANRSMSPSAALIADILKKAQEMDIPIVKEDVKVRVAEDHIEVNISYLVPISLPGYIYNYQFEIKSRK